MRLNLPKLSLYQFSWLVLTALFSSTTLASIENGSDLFQYKPRDFTPNFGRYIQADPAGLDGGSFSTYNYVNNNPASLIDPLGLWGIQIGLFAGLGGEISAGQNPDGTAYATLNLGAGVGGGIKYDPLATSPGYSLCNQYKPVIYTGLYAKASASVTTVYGSVSTALGRNHCDCSNSEYSKKPTPTMGFRNPGFSASASTGTQLAVSGPGFNLYKLESIVFEPIEEVLDWEVLLWLGLLD